MIIGDVLKFGYDDIGVNFGCQTISFQQFKSLAICGSNVSYDDAEWVGEEINIRISYEDYCELNKALVKVLDKELKSFAFKGYTFDFTNFNEESVKVCKKALDIAIISYFISIAA